MHAQTCTSTKRVLVRVQPFQADLPRIVPVRLVPVRIVPVRLIFVLIITPALSESLSALSRSRSAFVPAPVCVITVHHVPVRLVLVRRIPVRTVPVGTISVP